MRDVADVPEGVVLVDGLRARPRGPEIAERAIGAHDIRRVALVIVWGGGDLRPLPPRLVSAGWMLYGAAVVATAVARGWW